MALVLSFDFSKAFDSVSYRLVTNKRNKKVPHITPYIVIWVIDFLIKRSSAKGMCTQSHGPIFACQSRCTQGTVLGPVLFTVMVNDIRPTS